MRRKPRYDDLRHTYGTLLPPKPLPVSQPEKSVVLADLTQSPGLLLRLVVLARAVPSVPELGHDRVRLVRRSGLIDGNVLVSRLPAVFEGLLGQRFGVERQAHHAVSGGEVHQPYAHGLPAGPLDLGRAGPDHAARGGDR